MEKVDMGRRRYKVCCHCSGDLGRGSINGQPVDQPRGPLDALVDARDRVGLRGRAAG